MAQQIFVVKGPNQVARAKLTRKDIRHGWRRYHPTKIDALQSDGATAGSVVGGAVVGGLLLGPLGAVVGGMAGGRHARTTFLVETAEGVTLVCQCPAKPYPGVFVAHFEDRGEGSEPPNKCCAGPTTCSSASAYGASRID